MNKPNHNKPQQQPGNPVFLLFFQGTEKAAELFPTPAEPEINLRETLWRQKWFKLYLDPPKMFSGNFKHLKHHQKTPAGGWYITKCYFYT